MVEKISSIVQLFAENEQAEAALKEAKSVAEAVALLAQYGIEMTEEEFVATGKEITSDELSEEMLMLVAGGGKGWNKFWGGVRDFFQGFLDAF